MRNKSILLATLVAVAFPCVAEAQDQFFYMREKIVAFKHGGTGDAEPAQPEPEGPQPDEFGLVCQSWVENTYYSGGSNKGIKRYNGSNMAVRGRATIEQYCKQMFQTNKSSGVCATFDTGDYTNAYPITGNVQVITSVYKPSVYKRVVQQTMSCTYVGD